MYTAQALLAVMASMYAVFHGPDGLKAIAQRIHRKTVRLAIGLEELVYIRLSLIISLIQLQSMLEMLKLLF